MNFQIFRIQQKWIKELVSLSDLFLGVNYLNQEYFNNVISKEDYNGFCVFDNEKLIAFLVFYNTNSENVIKRLGDNSLKFILDKNIICIDTMVVALDDRKKGIGKMLVDSVIKLNKNEAGFIMYAWKQNGVINMEKIANEYKFKLIKEYSNLWKRDCENNSFKCPVRVDVKNCLCSCVLYYKNQEK